MYMPFAEQTDYFQELVKKLCLLELKTHASYVFMHHVYVVL